MIRAIRWRWAGWSAAAVAAVAVVVAVAAAAPSYAATGLRLASDAGEFCGEEVIGIDPGAGGLAALSQELKQDENSLIGKLAGAAHLGSRVCGPARFAMEVGADILVGGVLLDVYDVKVPFKADLFVGIIKTALENTQPHVLPDVGGSGTTVAPVWGTGGQGLSVNSNPGYRSHTGVVIPEGERVTVLCTAVGRVVHGPDGVTSLFDYVFWNGSYGFVADQWIYTGTGQPVAPSC